MAVPTCEPLFFPTWIDRVGRDRFLVPEERWSEAGVAKDGVEAVEAGDVGGWKK